MAKKLTSSQQRRRNETKAAIRNIVIVVGLIGIVATIYVRSMLSHKALDPVTLCPPSPSALTVLLVDVTDPMNLPQRQDFRNQLDKLSEQIPRHGKLVVAKVDPVSDQLLTPIITRCNPGTAADESEFDGNPQKVEKQRQDQFLAPLRAAFDQLMTASAADRSPVLESIQSVNLTELQRGMSEAIPKRLIVASDLLQNTKDISFYNDLPDPAALVGSQSFSRVRTDLKGVNVELWMLQRGDSTRTQPRALPALWEAIIDAQGGQLMRVYTVSG